MNDVTIREAIGILVVVWLTWLIGKELWSNYAFRYNVYLKTFRQEQFDWLEANVHPKLWRASHDCIDAPFHFVRASTAITFKLMFGDD